MSKSTLDSPDTHRFRKKERTRARILANAIALFRKSGIRATRSLEIAAASEVSPATLFNYFPTKDDLAEAWVRGEIGAWLDEIARQTGDRAIRSKVRSACTTLAEDSCGERDLRLEAWRNVARAANPTLRHTKSLEALIAREQDRARMRADLSCHALAGILGDAIEGGLIAGLRESSDPKQVAAALRSGVDLVLDGLRRRNERVSPPTQWRD